MAHLRQDRNGNFLVAFRWQGVQFTRSLDTKDEALASTSTAKVEETLMRLKRGWLTIPDGVEPGRFIASGGEITAAPEPKGDASPGKPVTLEELFRRHREDIPGGARESTTLATEKIHCNHFARILKGSTPVESLTLAVAQRYVAARSREIYRNKPIRPETILKELETLRKIWGWGAKVGLVGVSCSWSLADLQVGKQGGREPFRTFDEIERQLKRGGLSEAERERLWECLYLGGEEVERLLGYVEANAAFPWIHPMFVFCALTGARRSEICRSRIDDFDFEHGVVHIREKKRDRSRSETMRSVDLHPSLVQVTQAWLEMHPGGVHTLANSDGEAITIDQATWHFNRTLAGHARFCKIPGFHTLRHSFASICASRGIDQRIIDKWMGHQTAEMRARYQHLFPASRKSAIESLLG